MTAAIVVQLAVLLVTRITYNHTKRKLRRCLVKNKNKKVNIIVEAAFILFLVKPKNYTIYMYWLKRTICFILKIPFYGRPLKTDGRPRPVLSLPSLLLHARPGWREGERKGGPLTNNIIKDTQGQKHPSWGAGCGSQNEPSKRKPSMSSVVTYKHQVWKSSTRGEFIVTGLSFTKPWASFMFPHLSFTVPFSFIQSASLFLFVQRDGDRRPFSFYLLWLQSVL